MPDVVAAPDGAAAWTIGDTEFIRRFERGSTAQRFFIQKDQAIIDHYTKMAPRFPAAQMLELGIAAGGSTAMLALLMEPAHLVACDIKAEPVPALTEFIEHHGLGATVRPHYGVDQGERAQLARIVDDEFGDADLDLVIDDASHVFEPTIASFDLLFPRIRPGGMFVIEDWAGHYLIAESIAEAQREPDSAAYAAARANFEKATAGGAVPRPPLARIAVELVLASVLSPDVVPEVTVNQHWISVTRGPAALDRETFRLANQYVDHFGWLAEEPGDWWLSRMWRPTTP